MTHYYYDADNNVFYHIDRMPPREPENNEEMISDKGLQKEWGEFYNYLLGRPKEPHTFTGYSRVVPEGEIEWRYCNCKVGNDCPYKKGKWLSPCRVATPKITEERKKTSDNWYQDIYPKGELVIMDPDGWDRVNWHQSWYVEMITREEFERRVAMSTVMRQKVSDAGTTSINESPGYTSTSGEEEDSKPRHIGFDDLISAINIAISYRDFGVLSEILKQVKGQSPPPQTGEKEHRIIIEGNWYPAECNSCGWIGSSQYLEGCHPIADTGDHSDPLCPICGSKDVDSTEELHDLQSLVSRLGKAHVAAKYFRENYERVAEELYVSQLQPPAAQSDQEAAEKGAISEWGNDDYHEDERRNYENGFTDGCNHVRGQQQVDAVAQHKLWEEVVYCVLTNDKQGAKEILQQHYILTPKFTARHPSPKPGSHDTEGKEGPGC